MTMSFPGRPPDVMATELPDGESVLLDLKTEAYFGLNELGTAVWSVLGEAELGELVHHGRRDRGGRRPSGRHRRAARGSARTRPRDRWLNPRSTPCISSGR
ncbi:MAG: PqqD family protein [Acidimicrobiales bacterium]